MSQPLAPAGYTLVREIGSGGFGSVWLARSRTGLWRAVKIVASPTSDDRDLFRRELAGITRFQAATLGQPTQLAILHVETDDEGRSLRYVMELADDASGEAVFDPETYVPLTLKELRRRRGRLPAAEVARIGSHVARGLSLLHGKGLLHRDIKPSNIILVGGVPKLSDLGLVTSSETAATQVGTQGYLAPEGPGTPAADLYSLGLVLFELATNQPPQEFPCLPRDAASWPDAGDFGALNEIILRACSRDPGRRHATAGDLADDLQAFLAGRSITSIDAARRRWKRRGIAALVALGVALTASGVALREAAVARDREALEAARAQFAVVHAFQTLQDNRRAAALELWRSVGEGRQVPLARAFFEGQWKGDPCVVLARGDQPWSGGRASTDSRSWIASAADGRVGWGSVDSTNWAWVPGLRVSAVGPWRPGGTEAWVVVSNRWRSLRPSDGRLGTPPLDWPREGHAPDGSGLVALDDASRPARLRVWREGAAGTEEVPLPFPAANLSWASLAPGARGMAVAWFSMTNGLRARRLEFWDLAPPRMLTGRSLEGWIQGLHALANGDAVHVADGRRAEWLPPGGGPPRYTDALDDVVQSSAVAPDGTTWVAGTVNGRVRWRDVADAGAPPQLRDGHSGAVAAVAWLGGDSPVVSFGTDGTVRRWPARLSTRSWEGRWTAEFGDAVLGPGGTHVLATRGKDRVVVMDAATLEETGEVAGAFQPVAPGPGGDRAWYLGPGLTLQLRSWPSHALLWESPTPSTNHPTYVIRAPGHVLLGFEDGAGGGWAMVQALDTQAPPRRVSLRLPARALALRPDGRELACALQDGAVVVVSLADGRPTWTLPPRPDHASALGWSPDGHVLVVGRTQGAIEFHRPGIPGHPGVFVQAHAGHVTGMAWDGLGAGLVTFGDDGHLRFWDARRFQPMGSWKAEETGLAGVFVEPGRPLLLTFSVAGRVRRWPMEWPMETGPRGR